MTRGTLAGLLMAFALLGSTGRLFAQQVRVTPYVFTGTSTNHGHLLSLWQSHAGLTSSTAEEEQGLVLRKANESADLGVPYANLEGTAGLTVRELGFDVSSQKKNGYAAAHCNTSPTIEITLTNGTTYAFYCTKGKHSPIAQTAWDRVRFTDADAKPISCHSKGCVMQPWPGFASEKAIVATPKDNDPKSSTFQIIMFDGYDSSPDFSGVTRVDNIDLNGTLIGDGKGYTIK